MHCFEFLDQINLAYLYSICDIALTRGSVTSLAEQQLFGIKKIIIPLPRTGGNHQFYNALWYSEAYEDIVVEQDSQLVHNLTVFLVKLDGYKKSWDGVDTEELEKAKEIVWHNMLNNSLH